MKTINWNIPKLQRLKDAYDRAKATGRDQFNFEGNRFVTAYAKYLIEFLDGHFGFRPKPFKMPMRNTGVIK